MADSFFGFSSAIPMDDDSGGGTHDESEDDYDALNDETFGAAINGDWEEVHENLVRLEKNHSRGPIDEDNDLEINFGRVALDDCIVATDDFEGRVQLDPSVWANTLKPTMQSAQHHIMNASTLSNASSDNANVYNNSESFLMHHLSQRQQQYQNAQQPQSQTSTALFGNMAQTTMSMPKICTLEDIERNIRNQIPANVKPNNSYTCDSNSPAPLSPHQDMRTNQTGQRPSVPPGLPTRGPYFPQQIGTGNRIPPGFSNLPMIQPGGPHFGHMPPPPPHMQRPMPPNIPIPLNNFPMHHNFGPIRPSPPQMAGSGSRVPHLVSPHFQQNMQQLHSSVNQFNKRLVQEIQQNHPMLSNYGNRMGNVNAFGGNFGGLQPLTPGMAMNGNGGNQFFGGQQQQMHQQMMHQQQYQQQHPQQHQQQQHQQQHQQQQQQQHVAQLQHRNNGNLNLPDYDEYANLMSNRDKQWLIGIQLSQLNTDTPYIDDFYYTVFKERKANLRGDRRSEAHKDNTLNHPLTQPKGHAHLVLISMSKNGSTQRHNGHNNRERKNSESGKSQQDKELTPRTYTPIQFENSLGKLQCGSVTAPRKIIDMDIVGQEMNNERGSSIGGGGNVSGNVSGMPGGNTSLSGGGCGYQSDGVTHELSTQRRSRQLLLHIETLYKVILKMEDLENPIAIATALVVREKKEKEREMALEMAMAEIIENNLTTNVNTSPQTVETKITQLNDKFPEPEKFGDLQPKLMAGLTPDKVAAMMTVRKGRTLLRRILPHINTNAVRSDVWSAIFTALPVIVKKDKDYTDGTLQPFYTEFKLHVHNSDIKEILKIANSMSATDKKLGYIFLNRFCIVCVLEMIQRMENIFVILENHINTDQKLAWTTFLVALSNSVSPKMTTLKRNNEIVSDEFKILATHLDRFTADIKSQTLLTIFEQILVK